MSLSYFDVTVPLFRRGLTGLCWVLAKAEGHFAAEGRDTAELIGDRIASDMQPFAFQMAQVVNHSRGAIERLAGRDAPLAKPPATLAEARQLLAGALDVVNAAKPEDFDGCEPRQITWQPNPAFSMGFDGARAYLFDFAIPNFYFHTTTAYAIARKNGVSIGKRDFMAHGEAPAGL